MLPSVWSVAFRVIPWPCRKYDMIFLTTFGYVYMCTCTIGIVALNKFAMQELVDVQLLKHSGLLRVGLVHLNC